MNDDEKPRLEIDWVKAFAGALAAVSSAVLLSTLGAAGTLIGAAIGSLALTITSAFYQQGLARSRQKLAEAQNVALAKVNRAQSEVRRANRASSETATDAHLASAEAELASAEEELAEANSELDEATDDADVPGWRERLVLLPWKRIALAAAGLFLVAMLVITAFELLAGRTVSSITGGSDSTGGTSISRVTGTDSGAKHKQEKNDPDKDRNQPSGSTSPTDGSSDQPTDEPTSGTGSETAEPTEQPTEETSQEPTEAPSETPTEAPTEESTPQVAPSAPAS